MRKRTSGCRGEELLLTSHRVWRLPMTTSGPLWWTRPVYSAAARLLTNRMKAAVRRHAFKLAKEIPAGEEALKDTSDI